MRSVSQTFSVVDSVSQSCVILLLWDSSFKLHQNPPSPRTCTEIYYPPISHNKQFAILSIHPTPQASDPYLAEFQRQFIRGQSLYRKDVAEGGSCLSDLSLPLCGLQTETPNVRFPIQVREEYPILYSHKTQLNIQVSLLLYYNITTTCFGLNYRPSSGCIWNLYSYNYSMRALIYCVDGVGGI